jgi:Right handed beta helix region
MERQGHPMNARLTATLCLWAVLAEAAHAQPQTLFVSPSGADTNDGSKATPFATLAKARDAIRDVVSKDGLPDGGVRVLVRGGTYFLAQPIMLGPEDSGTAEAPIVYAASPGENVVLSGGRTITGWNNVGGNRWEVAIPEVKEGAWFFRQLFADGSRLQRARIPNEGHLVTTGALSSYAELAAKRYGGYDGIKKLRKEDPEVFCGFSFKPGDIGRWTNISDAEIITYHSWECSWQTVRSIDFDSNDLYFNTPCRYPVSFFSPHCRYRVENVPEALDAPGEWYLSRETGILTYLAGEGEDPEEMSFVAPVLDRLLVLEGDPEQDRLVEHVSFSGFSFQYARYPMGLYDIAPDWPKTALAADPDWPTDFAPGYTDAQAAPRCGQVIEFNGTSHCVLEDCEVAHIGNFAVKIFPRSHHNRIAGCHMHDLGGGGVLIGQVNRDVAASRVPRENAASHNDVVNNRILNGGLVHPSAAGIWIAQSHHNVVAHNEVANLGYSGISLGWTWGRAANHSDNNVIEANHIHHVLQELADGGGIYTLGVLDGCVLRANHLHDIQRPDGAIGSHNNGFFFDQGSQALLNERNVIHDVGHDDVRFNQNKREDHTWVGNIFEGEGGDVASGEAKALIDNAGPE